MDWIQAQFPNSGMELSCLPFLTAVSDLHESAWLGLQNKGP